MMEKKPVSQDDLMDVVEMTNKLETLFSEVLSENELNLAISALMSATINCLIAQCKSMDEVIFYRNIFMQIFDSSIKTIKMERQD